MARHAATGPVAPTDWRTSTRAQRRRLYENEQVHTDEFPQPVQPAPVEKSLIESVTWPFVAMVGLVGLIVVAAAMAFAGDTQRASSLIAMPLVCGTVALVVRYRMDRNRP